jgi:hypothetical protein
MTDETRNNISIYDEEVEEISLEQLQAQLEKYKITDRKLTDEELPQNGAFDLYASISLDPKVFGLAKDFSKSGLAARYLGNVIIESDDGRGTNMYGALGFIVAESNGRIILETDYGYFGWLNPEDYEIINLVASNSTAIN